MNKIKKAFSKFRSFFIPVAVGSSALLVTTPSYAVVDVAKTVTDSFSAAGGNVGAAAVGMIGLFAIGTGLALVISFLRK